ncbi:hypothetical protein QTP88_002447 [Uroleucon formosanum]
MDSKWTAERDAEVVQILTDDASINKDRRYYHVHEKFDLIEVAGLIVKGVRKNKCMRSVIVRPILSSSFNERLQVDLVDFQSLPDGDLIFILHYKEHLTKFSFFRPLK